jgi:hypothetical protein
LLFSDARGVAQRYVTHRNCPYRSYSSVMGASQKNTQEQPPLANDDELVREEFARLLRSETLRRSTSHLRLLQYLVENKLQGDHGALREMAIGIEVFQRNPASFDPKEDPIVRVNVGRLREKIDQVRENLKALKLLERAAEIHEGGFARCKCSRCTSRCMQTQDLSRCSQSIACARYLKV